MGDKAVSLYFGLKEGEKADLEVVARAALEWVEALRVAAGTIDPNARISVEIINAEEGSLWLNTILDWAENQLEAIQEGAGKHPRLRKLALALAIFIPVSGIPTYEYYFGDSLSALSEEDRDLIRQLLERLQESPDVQESKQGFFRALEKDPSIVSIGVSEERSAPLLAQVPSNEFAERGGLWALEEEQNERTLRPVVDVTLVAPVLISRPRSWRFKPEGLPEFTAIMRDKRFLAALEESHVQEKLRTGIPMTLRLEVKQRHVGGTWVDKRKGRSVTEVIAPKIR